MSGPGNQPPECSREKAGQAVANGTTSKFIAECNAAKEKAIKNGTGLTSFQRAEQQATEDAERRRQVAASAPPTPPTPATPPRTLGGGSDGVSMQTKVALKKMGL